MKVFLVSLVVLLAALSGCSGDPQQEVVETGEDEGRRSVGGDGGNNTDPPHTKVVLLDTAVDLIGQQTLAFDVVVPDNVTNVDFSISYGNTGTPAGGVAVFSAFRIELAGCGAYDQGTGTSMGTITLSDRLCKDAAGGTAKLTVTNTGFVQGGPLRVVGHMPKPVGNATAGLN